MLEAGGLRAGVDFFLAFSPERVDPGNPTFNTHNVPKVVGGIGPSSTELAAALYGAAIERIVRVSSPQVAEMVKLLENTFRAVNIALVNEIALMCDRLRIDVWEVVNAAATKPFGFMPFYPGPGLGGHCIPIDPFYLSWKAKQSGFDPRFIELAGQINASMPHFVVDKITDALNRDRKSLERVDRARARPRLQARHRRYPRVAVAGRDDAAPSEGRQRPLRRSLRARPAGPRMARRLRPRNRSRSRRRRWPAADCVAILTDHRTIDYEMVREASRLIVDTRNAIAGDHPHVFKLGAPARTVRDQLAASAA